MEPTSGSWMEMSVSRCSTNAGNTTAFPILEDLSFLDFSTFQVVLVVKNPPANYKRHRFNPWVGKISWRRNWQPTLVFLPGKFHGQRSLASYSPQGRKVRHDWVCMHHHRNQVRVCFLLLWQSNHDVQTLPWTISLTSPASGRWPGSHHVSLLTRDPVSVSWGPKFSTETCSGWKKLKQCICNLDHFLASRREHRFSKSQKIRLNMQELHQSIHPLKTIAHVRNKISVCDVKIS